MRRLVVLGAALAFLVFFGFLTWISISEHGLTFEGVVSICVVVLLAVGVVGALINPPRY
jgi:hypothetical protein